MSIIEEFKNIEALKLKLNPRFVRRKTKRYGDRDIAHEVQEWCEKNKVELVQELDIRIDVVEADYDSRDPTPDRYAMFYVVERPEAMAF